MFLVTEFERRRNTFLKIHLFAKCLLLQHAFANTSCSAEQCVYSGDARGAGGLGCPSPEFSQLFVTITQMILPPYLIGVVSFLP